MRKVSIKPVTTREKFIANRHGNDDWVVLKDDTPWCFDKRPSVLVTKNNHMRWILKEQIIE